MTTIELVNGKVGELFSRPWGTYLQYAENEPCTVKLMKLNPLASLSLQFHEKRDQVYIPMSDDMLVEYCCVPVFNSENRNDEISAVIELYCINIWDTYKIFKRTVKGESFLFKRGMPHRITNVERFNSAYFIDIAFGENDEDDIIRIQDKYGRGQND